METQLNTEKSELFAGKMIGWLNGGALSLMISVGHRTGLFETMDQGETFTSESLAEAAGLQERYVREWLGAMTVGGIVEYDAETGTYSLPREHSRWLTRKAAKDNIAAITQYIGLLGSVEDKIVRCFQEGGGVPYEAYGRFHEVMAEDSGQSLIPVIVEEVLPLAEGLREKLEQGINVLDIGCGRGRALQRLAAEFPNSRFTGYDLSTEAIAHGRAEAARQGLTNLRFEVMDVARLDEPEKYGLITAFDAIHDQAWPREVVSRVFRALAPDGVFLVQDIDGSRHVHLNLDHPVGPMLYTVSCMHCMTVSLAQGGEGLGTMWGRETAEEIFREAGFNSVEISRLGHDLQNCFYIVRK